MFKTAKIKGLPKFRFISAFGFQGKTETYGLSKPKLRNFVSLPPPAVLILLEKSKQERAGRKVNMPPALHLQLVLVTFWVKWLTAEIWQASGKAEQLCFQFTNEPWAQASKAMKKPAQNAS